MYTVNVHHRTVRILRYTVCFPIAQSTILKHIRQSNLPHSKQSIARILRDTVYYTNIQCKISRDTVYCQNFNEHILLLEFSRHSLLLKFQGMQSNTRIFNGNSLLLEFQGTQSYYTNIQSRISRHSLFNIKQNFKEHSLLS